MNALGLTAAALTFPQTPVHARTHDDHLVSQRAYMIGTRKARTQKLESPYRIDEHPQDVTRSDNKLSRSGD